jgi:hypothetical protein
VCGALLWHRTQLVEEQAQRWRQPQAMQEQEILESRI